MTLASDAKFKEKLTCGFENVTRNLENFHQSSRKGSHCLKSIQRRIFFWSVFSSIWTEYGDKSLYSVRILENTNQKNSKRN